MLGFTIGCVCQVIGSILGVAAMYLNDPTTLFMGCMFVGLGQVIQMNSCDTFDIMFLIDVLYIIIPSTIRDWGSFIGLFASVSN